MSERLTKEQSEARENPPSFADAACRGTNPLLFFAERGDNATSADAKRICATCPIQAECLDYAVRAGEQYGIWGGVSISAYMGGKSTPLVDA